MSFSQSCQQLGAAFGRLVDRVTSIITFADRFCAGVQKLAKDILTEDDGESFCGWRFGMFVGVVAATAFTSYQVFFVAHALEAEMLKAYAQSIGWIIGAGGAGLAAKQWSQGGNVPAAPESGDQQ